MSFNWQHEYIVIWNWSDMRWLHRLIKLKSNLFFMKIYYVSENIKKFTAALFFYFFFLLSLVRKKSKYNRFMWIGYSITPVFLSLIVLIPFEETLLSSNFYIHIIYRKVFKKYEDSFITFCPTSVELTAASFFLI